MALVSILNSTCDYVRAIANRQNRKNILGISAGRYSIDINNIDQIIKILQDTQQTTLGPLYMSSKKCIFCMFFTNGLFFMI